MENNKVKLFYSYCHADAEFRKDMEKSLTLLKDNGQLDEWYDRKILAGENISEKIKEEMKSSDIIVYLISPDFLSSKECKKEEGSFVMP